MGATAGRHEWAFITSHFLVLLCLAEDSEARMSDVAERLDLTERRVQAIAAELLEAGYLEKIRVGRRNRYLINREMPLRHLQTQHRRLGDLLDLISDDEGSD
ncbi:MAG TPA: winged helix-turn-helix transcriptional regulator [Acidimicrobiales bacterium]|nr:winged helix-turn-helix transcriptional regulator [Acidimicrobiales bacterium]